MDQACHSDAAHCLLVRGTIHVQSKSIHTKEEVRPLLVLDFEEFDTVHLKILCDLQVLEHGVFPAQRNTNHTRVARRSAYVPGIEARACRSTNPDDWMIVTSPYEHSNTM